MASAPAPGRPAVLIRNPIAGRPRRARCAAAVADALGEGGWMLEERATTAAGEATRIASEATLEGAEAVFVLGGDGTLREAAAGLLAAGAERTEAGPALGILPGGTANVLARTLGLPRHPLAAARAFTSCSRRQLDVGLCGATPFLMMVSAGLDAAVLAGLDPGLKASLGRAGIFLQGLGSWWRYDYPRITPTVDGRPAPPATFAAACNIPHFGGGFAMAPAARWDDRRLDLIAFHGTGRRATLGFALALAAGRHLHRPDVTATPFDHLLLEGPDTLHLQLDGDPCPEPLPATIRLSPHRLPILLPR